MSFVFHDSFGYKTYFGYLLQYFNIYGVRNLKICQTIKHFSLVGDLFLSNLLPIYCSILACKLFSFSSSFFLCCEKRSSMFKLASDLSRRLDLVALPWLWLELIASAITCQWRWVEAGDRGCGDEYALGLFLFHLFCVNETSVGLCGV